MATTQNTRNTAYAPFTSSPLNPNREASTKPVRRRRSRSSRKCISVSPSQRLLRQKAAEAWRSQAMSRRVAEYETRAIAAISQRKKEMESRENSFLRPLHRHAPMALRNPVVDFSAKGDDKTPYMFHQMPDLGFFTPRKVVLAVGMMRALPSLRAQEPTTPVSESMSPELRAPPVPELMC